MTVIVTTSEIEMSLYKNSAILYQKNEHGM